jgi:hypothetical protein
MGALEIHATFLVRKYERKKLLGKAKCRWEDDIKEDVDRIYPAQERIQWSDLMNAGSTEPSAS